MRGACEHVAMRSSCILGSFLLLPDCALRRHARNGVISIGLANVSAVDVLDASAGWTLAVRRAA